MIAVLDYGMGNLRSVARAVERVGGAPVITPDPEVVVRADAAILPGVGAFGRGMRGVRAAGLDQAIHQVVAAGKLVLGVCLGLQILFEGSEEAEEAGLGILAGRIERLQGAVKVPHMGWNEVMWTGDHPIARAAPSGSHFYFVHSFALPANHPATVGVTDYARPFAAAVAVGNVFATQFHPEKSGEAGLALYEAFVRRVGEVAA
jgi:glutamine amidotransferase